MDKREGHARWFEHGPAPAYSKHSASTGRKPAAFGNGPPAREQQFTAELLAFFFGHMLMVAATGLRKNMVAIVTGWIRVDRSYERGELVFSVREPVER